MKIGNDFVHVMISMFDGDCPHLTILVQVSLLGVVANDGLDDVLLFI